jgi:hypothetical protein
VLALERPQGTASGRNTTDSACWVDDTPPLGTTVGGSGATAAARAIQGHGARQARDQLTGRGGGEGGGGDGRKRDEAAGDSPHPEGRGRLQQPKGWQREHSRNSSARKPNPGAGPRAAAVGPAGAVVAEPDPPAVCGHWPVFPLEANPSVTPRAEYPHPQCAHSVTLKDQDRPWDARGGIQVHATTRPPNAQPFRRIRHERSNRTGSGWRRSRRWPLGRRTSSSTSPGPGSQRFSGARWCGGRSRGAAWRCCNGWGARHGGFDGGGVGGESQRGGIARRARTGRASGWGWCEPGWEKEGGGARRRRGARHGG